MKYLQRDDIQGIVMHGYGRLHARFVLLGVIDADKVRGWLESMAEELEQSSAAHPPEPGRENFRIHLAFSHDGLEVLGFEMAVFDSVSQEFANPGDLRSHRQRILGEFGDSDPSRWLWGGPENTPVDIVLMIYADTEEALDAKYTDLVDSRGKGCIVPIGVVEDPRNSASPKNYLPTERLPGNKEHFGFRDGISQPRIQDGEPEGPDNIKAGEFLFGYENEYGQIPKMPSAADNLDFGLNGSFMVLRQLEQAVNEFWDKTCNDAGDDVVKAKRLASRRVGRWPNGAPVLYADRSDRVDLSKENEFNFSSDPFGQRCPIGAHIRRANPRDSLSDDPLDPTREVRRHRIIRRARAYGKPAPDTLNDNGQIDIVKLRNTGVEHRRGLHFVCFNTDIGRQFEFILQTWVINQKFAGGYEEIDALFSDTDAAQSQSPACDDLDSAIGSGSADDYDSDIARNYITVRGGGYFFLPGIKAIHYLACEPAGEESVNSVCLEKKPANENFHIANLVRNLTDKVHADYPMGGARRDAHPKQHGTVYARFEIEPGLDEHLRRGLFRDAGNDGYDAIVRFSNQKNEPKPDYDNDVRGMAVKVCGVNGDMFWHDGKQGTSQDFLAITHPVFTTKDVCDFDGLTSAILKGGKRGWLSFLYMIKYFFSRLPNRLYILRNLRAAFKRHANPLQLEYFSTVPYLFGPDRAMKYRFVPTEEADREAVGKKPRKGQASNFLQQEMSSILSKRDFRFNFEVQLFVDEDKTPIENAAKEWRESDSEFIRVATLTIPEQDFVSRASLDYGEHLSFSPWNCLSEHRPIGGVNRARRVVMREVSALRHHMNRIWQQEPMSAEELKEYNTRLKP